MFDQLTPEQIQDMILKLTIMKWLCLAIAVSTAWWLIASIREAIKKGKEKNCEGKD